MIQTSRINMSKTVQISAAFSTILSRLDSFESWPYPPNGLPKQLAIHGFYKMPGNKGDLIACFSCGEAYYFGNTIMTDEHLMD
ncbi:hypothetical protein V8E51_009544 [Hyaloscypha variabilis]